MGRIGPDDSERVVSSPRQLISPFDPRAPHPPSLREHFHNLFSPSLRVSPRATIPPMEVALQLPATNARGHPTSITSHRGGNHHSCHHYLISVIATRVL